MKSILTAAITLTASLSITSVVAKPGGEDGAKGGKGGKDASAIFKAIDTNSDGKITAKELANSKRFKDASPKEVGAAFAKKDLNGDGAITPHEFAKTFGKSHKGGKGGKAGKGGHKGGKKGKGDGKKEVNAA